MKTGERLLEKKDTDGYKPPMNSFIAKGWEIKHLKEWKEFDPLETDIGSSILNFA